MSSTQQPRQGLPKYILAALAGPSISLSALSLPLVVYLPEFYSGELGLDLSLVGSIFMVVRLLDIGFDPVIGGIMDRTKGRFGRYRPWLLAGTPMIMLGMGMLFGASPGVGPAYLTGWLLLAYAGWSILSLAQLSLAANISPDYHERSRIYAWWQAAFMIGMMISMLLPKIVSELGYHGASAGMRAMSWLVILTAPIMVGIMIIAVKERPAGGTQHGSDLRSYFGLLRHTIVRRLLATELLLGLAGGTTSTLGLFFYTRVMDIGRADTGLVFIAHFAVGLCGTPLWSWLANRIGKHKALAVAALLYAIFQFLYLVAPSGSLAGLLTVAAISGIPYGAIALLPRAMMADISDFERLNTGAERTGLLFALLIGTWKIGQALSVGLMFLSLDFINFNPAPGALNGSSSLLGLMTLYIALPALLSLLAAVTILRYPLTAERHAHIRKELEARERA